MNKQICLLLIITAIYSSCSSSDDSDSTTPARVEKDLLKMSGDWNHWFNYVDGKINKAWTTNLYHRSQMVYNSNGTLSKEYRFQTFTDDNENFEWEIPVSDVFRENIYEGGRLIEIWEHDSGDSWKRVEYMYQGDLVIEKRQYDGQGLYRINSYQYNSQNEIILILNDESANGGSSHAYQVTFDDQVNPYYKIWKESKLTFDPDVGGPIRYNLEFYPHNILNIQESPDDIKFNATYTYDEDYHPLTMHAYEGSNAGDDYFFEYQ